MMSSYLHSRQERNLETILVRIIGKSENSLDHSRACLLSVDSSGIFENLREVSLHFSNILFLPPEYKMGSRIELAIQIQLSNPSEEQDRRTTKSTHQNKVIVIWRFSTKNHAIESKNQDTFEQKLDFFIPQNLPPRK